MDKKSKSGFFVGYPEGVKGFRVWIPGSSKIEISRDVLFKEYSVVNLESNLSNLGKEDGIMDAKTETSPEEETFDLADESIEGDKKDSSPGPDQGSKQVGADINVQKQTESIPSTSYRSKLRSQSQSSSKTNSGMYANTLEGFAFVCSSFEPATYKEALESDEAYNWKKAMDDEMEEAHQKNGTWNLVDPPLNCKVIKNRWVYKAKLLPNNTIERYKARLVAKGFNQL